SASFVSSAIFELPPGNTVIACYAKDAEGNEKYQAFAFAGLRSRNRVARFGRSSRPEASERGDSIRPAGPQTRLQVSNRYSQSVMVLPNRWNRAVNSSISRSSWATRSGSPAIAL